MSYAQIVRRISSLVLAGFSAGNLAAEEALPAAVRTLLTTHCLRCHGGAELRGETDLSVPLRDETAVRNLYSVWKIAARLVAEGEMPPADEPQPTDAEKGAFVEWARTRFAAIAPRPAPFRARRLSAEEYRRTLETLFGFRLEVAAARSQQTKLETSLVMKLLPVDPRGASGFANDTHGNPLSPVLWERYGYLADTALERLFSADGAAALAAYVGPETAEHLDAAAGVRLLDRFRERAFRRPSGPDAHRRHAERTKGLSGAALIAVLRREMKLQLMSPEFLYRGFALAARPGGTAPVDPYELSERLSYFLWADMPDEALFAAAADGSLVTDAGLRAQVERLRLSPKSRSLAEVFAVQWLQLDEIDNVSKEVAYTSALKGQPLEFVDDLIRRDRPLAELLESRTEFVNAYLAGYYAADADRNKLTTRRPGVERETLPLERIEIVRTEGRGGLLTMPGILLMNKGPVQRGTWVAERILGDHLGEPPPDVPPVKPAPAGGKTTFRSRFAAHRDHASCAVCHNRIDPLGFAFEAYDAMGRYRPANDVDRQGIRGVGAVDRNEAFERQHFDASGALPGGETFENLAGLKRILLGSRRRQFTENLVRRMLAYALCRELELHDEPVVEELSDRLAVPQATWGDLIREIAFSLPFRHAYFPSDEAAPAASSRTAP